MNSWIPKWSDVPEFFREEYFKDLVAEYGNEKVYANTNVDSSTQNTLNEYFAMDYICDRPERFIWLWHRALLAAYPVYADQMEMWKERKAYKWFFDNQKDNVKTHDGTFHLDEQTKAELIKKINDTLTELSKTVTDTDTTNNTNATGETHDEGEHQTDGTATTNTKGRDFSFAYPESNYSGGVIPYDLDNNPNVEFISAQADRVGRQNDVTHEEGSTSADGTSASEEKNVGTVDTSADYNGTKTGLTNENDNSTGEKGQDTKTHWEETTTYKGDSLVDIARELLEELPATDFFHQFVSKLEKCFMHDFLFDEIEEGL